MSHSKPAASAFTAEDFAVQATAADGHDHYKAILFFKERLLCKIYIISAYYDRKKPNEGYII